MKTSLIIGAICLLGSVPSVRGDSNCPSTSGPGGQTYKQQNEKHRALVGAHGDKIYEVSLDGRDIIVKTTVAGQCTTSRVSCISGNWVVHEQQGVATLYRCTDQL